MGESSEVWLARGEPNRKKIALTTLSDQVRELI
jgi:hypothetical protein